MTTREYKEAVDRWADNLYRFAAKSCRDTELAKDIVQDAYTRLWTHRKSVNFEKVKAYLFTSVNRLVIDHWRKNSRMTGHEENNELIAEDSAYSNLSEMLEAALKKLPEMYRIVVILRDLESMSYKEIGQVTDLSETQVKVYIYRARKKLKDILEKTGIVL